MLKNLFIHCVLILFNFVLFINTAKLYYYAKENISLTCRKQFDEWYIRKPFQEYYEPIKQNDLNYSIQKEEGLIILTPIHNATYKAKSNKTDDFLCEITTLLYVYPNEYYAYFTFNNHTRNLSFQLDKDWEPLTYIIDLETENPENFMINYAYKVEGLPLDGLTINGVNTRDTKEKHTTCSTKMTNYQCLQVQKAIHYSESLKNETFDFSYVVNYFRYIIDPKLQRGHILIKYNVEYPPVLKAFTDLKVNRLGKYILNCTPKYSNPIVRSYKWSLETKGVQNLNVNSSIYEFEYDGTLNDMIIVCNASNGKNYSLARFRIFGEVKQKPEESRESLPLWAKITIGIFSLLLGLCYIGGVYKTYQVHKQQKNGRIEPEPDILITGHGVVPTIDSIITAQTWARRFRLTKDFEDSNKDFLKHCFEIIEENIDVENIYKVNIPDDQVILRMVKNQKLEKNVDVHTVTRVVKIYIKNLDESLISTTLFEQLVESQKNGNTGGLKERLQNNFSNAVLLIYTLDHLKKVALNSRYNKMKPYDLAVEFAHCMRIDNKNNRLTHAIEYMIHEFMNYDVPKIIRDCVEAMQKAENMKTIYVNDGFSEHDLKKMSEIIDSYKNHHKVGNTIDDGAHKFYLTSILKHYLNSLKKPILPRESILTLIKHETIDLSTNEMKDISHNYERKLRDIFEKIENRPLILYLLSHFDRIIKLERVNYITRLKMVEVLGYILIENPRVDSTVHNNEEDIDAMVYILIYYDVIRKHPKDNSDKLLKTKKWLAHCLTLIENSKDIPRVVYNQYLEDNALKKIFVENETFTDLETAVCVAKRIIANLDLFKKDSFDPIFEKMNQGEIGTVRKHLMNNYERNGIIVIKILEHFARLNSSKSNKYKINAFSEAKELAPAMFESLKYEMKIIKEPEYIEMFNDDIICVLEYMITDFIHAVEITKINDCIEFIETNIAPKDKEIFKLYEYSDANNIEGLKTIDDAYKKSLEDGKKSIVNVELAVHCLLKTFYNLEKTIPELENILFLSNNKNDMESVIREMLKMFSKLRNRALLKRFLKHLYKIAEMNKKDYHKLASHVRSVLFDTKESKETKSTIKQEINATTFLMKIYEPLPSENEAQMGETSNLNRAISKSLFSLKSRLSLKRFVKDETDTQSYHSLLASNSKKLGLSVKRFLTGTSSAAACATDVTQPGTSGAAACAIEVSQLENEEQMSETPNLNQHKSKSKRLSLKNIFKGPGSQKEKK